MMMTVIRGQDDDAAFRMTGLNRIRDDSHRPVQAGVEVWLADGLAADEVVCLWVFQ